MSRLGTYLKRSFRINNRIVNINYIQTIYGKDLELRGKNHNREALVYTNANNRKKFGVRLQEYWTNNSPCCHRWTGGNCVGFNFTYKQARRIAIDFITKNKVYGEEK